LTLGCTAFSFWNPGESHLEDEVYVTQNCLPPYFQFVAYFIGLIGAVGLVAICLAVVIKVVLVNGGKVHLTSASIGVYGFGILFRIVLYVALLMHDVSALRYVCIGITFACDTVSCLLLMYQWLKVATTIDCFHSVSRLVFEQMRSIKFIFNFCGVLVTIYLIVFWTLCGVHRQNGNIGLANWFIAVNFMSIGLGSLCFTLVWAWIISKFKSLLKDNNLNQTESGKEAQMKLHFAGGLFIFVTVILFLFGICNFVWFLLTWKQSGPGGNIYLLMLMLACEYIPGLIMIRENFQELKKPPTNSNGIRLENLDEDGEDDEDDAGGRRNKNRNDNDNDEPDFMAD